MKACLYILLCLRHYLWRGGDNKCIENKITYTFEIWKITTKSWSQIGSLFYVYMLLIWCNITFRVYVDDSLSVILISEGNIVNHSINLFSMYNTASSWEDGVV
jgi:hypothetical protein